MSAWQRCHMQRLPREVSDAHGNVLPWLTFAKWTATSQVEIFPKAYYVGKSSPLCIECQKAPLETFTLERVFKTYNGTKIFYFDTSFMTFLEKGFYFFMCHFKKSIKHQLFFSNFTFIIFTWFSITSLLLISAIPL